METLAAHEAALFQFIEFLAARVKEVKEMPEGEMQFKITAGIGNSFVESPQAVIDKVLEGNNFALPLGGSGQYGVMKWIEYYEEPEWDSLIAKFGSPAKFTEAFPPRGSGDIRIYFHQRESIKFFANGGSFSGLSDLWERALAKIDYPMFAEDRRGFVYKNPAYKKKFEDQR